MPRGLHFSGERASYRTFLSATKSAAGHKGFFKSGQGSRIRLPCAFLRFYRLEVELRHKLHGASIVGEAVHEKERTIQNTKFGRDADPLRSSMIGD